MALARAADIRTIVISFTLAHATLSVVLGFAGAGLDDSGTVSYTHLTLPTIYSV